MYNTSSGTSAGIGLVTARDSMQPRGADVVARALERAGARTVFTLSGNHIMPIFDAVLETGLRLVHCRHEAAAVHMADAWARVTGECGVALVTGGPGHANAVPAALYGARGGVPRRPPVRARKSRRDRARQLPGDAPSRARGACRQGLLDGAFRSELEGDVERAFRLALSGRPGPVHVSLPFDSPGSGARRHGPADRARSGRFGGANAQRA
jgi:acetolactate synthase-1/2/3 large subunit